MTAAAPFQKINQNKNKHIQKYPHKTLDPIFKFPYNANLSSQSGRSAVRLAHLLWEQGVVSSNPTAPTTLENTQIHHVQISMRP